VREALRSNPHFQGEDSSAGGNEPNETAAEVTTEEQAADAGQTSEEVLAVDSIPEQESGPEEVLDEEVAAYMTEHAAEIAVEGEKPFQPIGGLEELERSEASPVPQTATTPAPASTESTQAPQVGTVQRHRPPQEEKRGSTLQKIAKLDIKGRIQLAMKGNKEERSILIRDGTKLVALAVLDSPKITDGEVEAFASQKNVLEAVLRGIPLKRRFAKHYPVIRNLVFNPRTPLDLSLGLMKNLLVNDLKNLASNKEVSETIRKLALKMFKQKMETSKK
jgi:hypothetical protein